jgi:hypothetical protein
MNFLRPGRAAFGYAYYRMRLGVPVRLEPVPEERVVPPVTIAVDTSQAEAALDRLADALRKVDSSGQD